MTRRKGLLSQVQLRRTLARSTVVDVCAACGRYQRETFTRQREADDSVAPAAEQLLRAILGRVDGTLWALRTLGAEAHRDELRRSLRDLLVVDEGRPPTAHPRFPPPLRDARADVRREP